MPSGRDIVNSGIDSRVFQNDSRLVTGQKANEALKLITDNFVNRVDDIIDNLLSTSTTQALSANQGLVLKGLIEGITLTSLDALKRDGSNANTDIDINTYSFNAKSLHVKGTGGAGHLGLKHQSSNITASANESSLGANSSGNPVWKNDGNALRSILLDNAFDTATSGSILDADKLGFWDVANSSLKSITYSSLKTELSNSFLPLAGNTALTPFAGNFYMESNNVFFTNETADGKVSMVFDAETSSISYDIFNKLDSYTFGYALSTSGFTVNCDNPSFNGINYVSDFSANFTDNSLTNRLYNDGRYIKLTTKGDLATYSTEYTRLGVGTNGQVLSANSATATGLEWVNGFTNPMTTDGDLIYGGASGTPTRLAIGTRGQIFQVGASSVPSWNSNILDTNGNTLLGLTTVASAVNFWSISNNSGTNSPILSTPNSSAGTNQVGIGGQINLGLGTGSGQSGILVVTTGGVTTSGTTVQTRFNLLQVANLNATNSAILINQPANNLSISTSLYTLLQGNTGLFINSPIAATSMVFRINNATFMTGTTTQLSIVNTVVLNFNPSYVSAGTTGNRTSNTTSGNIRIAAAGTTATLTNSLIGSNTRVFARIGNDTTAKSVAITESVGSCVFTLNAAATAEVEIAWFIIN